MTDIFYLDYRDNTARHFTSFSDDAARAIVELVEEKKMKERDYTIIDINGVRSDEKRNNGH